MISGRESRIQKLRFRIEGIVQGVGFRPFLHRLADRYQVSGWVRNTSSGLEGVLKGSSDSLEHFLQDVRESPPPMSSVEAVHTEIVTESVPETDSFQILPSSTDAGATLVSPDLAMCPECEAELYTPTDRRYRYPFINCTNCGPRYTIIRSLPYDRDRTVMHEFPMCEACEREYHDIHSRRYHAQPDCCPGCGPRIFYTGHHEDAPGSPSLYGEDALRASQKLLAEGGILAVKGIGGIHLACDASNSDAVKRLRQKKHRADKPLAVMCRSLDTVRRICRCSSAEEKILTGHARPILLLDKKDPASFRELSFSSRLGVMLPYTPLHTLLADGVHGGPDVLVLTSGNLPGCPVLTENDAALEALRHTADGFLLHNRQIENRCDDSLVSEWKGGVYFLRRSRGYAPRPLDFDKSADGIFAMGAEQKASFAAGKGTHIFLSPHIGDLKNAETFQHYTRTMQTYEDLFGLQPSCYVCDLHPDYLSSREAARLASQKGLPLLAVQHHWAHMASCMADNRLDAPCFGIIWDGTGLGTDRTIWGGEFLTGDLRDFKRAGSIRPVALPGGDNAIREIGRIALSLVQDAGISFSPCVPLPEEKYRGLSALIPSGLSPAASSIGRLFDGVCALILDRDRVDYEGEGAELVEALCPVPIPHEPEVLCPGLSYPLQFYKEKGLRVFDTRPLTEGILRDLGHSSDRGHIALRFLSTLVCMALEQCKALNPDRLPVVLSGGVFQNRFLLHGITAVLEHNGFTVYTHRRVSTNDEGICLGQLAVAQKKRSMEYVFSNANEN